MAIKNHQGGVQKMKEYKTLRVDPDQENLTMQYMTQFGWVLDSTQEIYNESQEIVGIEEQSKVTSYGSFMQGFTGNDGKVDTTVNVKTKTNVTHFIAMKFSRDKGLQGYGRLVELEQELNEEPVYKPEKLKTGKPKLLTIAFVVCTIISIVSLLQLLNGTKASVVELVLCIGVPVILFFIGLWRWLHYKKVHPLEVAEVNQAHQDNIETKEAYNKHIDEIIAEANDILKANNLL